MKSNCECQWLRLSLLVFVGFSILISPAFAIDWNWQMIQSNQKEVDKAMSEYNSGDADAAITTLSSLKSGATPDVRAIHIISDIYKEQKRYDDAKRELQEIINAYQIFMRSHNVGPNFDTCSLKCEIGDVCLEEGNVQEALSTFKEAQSLGPNRSTPRAGIARCYERLGDFDAAKTHYKSILELPSTNQMEKSAYLERISQIDKFLSSRSQQAAGASAPQSGGPPVSTAQQQAALPPAPQQIGTGPASRVEVSAPGSGSVGPARVNAPGGGPLQQAAEEISAKKYEAAIARLRALIQKLPTNAQAHYLLAVAYASSHQGASAREEYEATLKYAQDLALQKLATSGLAKLQVKH